MYYETFIDALINTDDGQYHAWSVAEVTFCIEINVPANNCKWEGNINVY